MTTEKKGSRLHDCQAGSFIMLCYFSGKLPSVGTDRTAVVL